MRYAYFGHHKCASTWIWEIIAQVCREAGLCHRLVLDPQTPSGRGLLTDYRHSFARERLGAYVAEQQVDFVSCITADREQAQALGVFRGVHVVRDPRDIIVSAYFSHRNSHPTEGLPHLQAHRERLQNVPKEEGLFLEMEFSAQELRDLAAWDYTQPHVLEAKMEALTTQPYDGFLEIFEFLGLMDGTGRHRMKDKARLFVRTALNRLSTRSPAWASLRRPVPVTGEMLLGRVYDNRFEKRAGGRALGEENAQSHYRRGVAGDWENHFSPEHTAYFERTHGTLLHQLGYATHPEGKEARPEHYA